MNFTKLVSVATSACFLFSFIAAEPLHAALAAAAGRSRLSLPSSAGRITAASDRGSERLIVLVQDLHCHAEVQRNIARAISLIDGRYGVDRIFVEGAAGAVDTAWLTGVTDESLRSGIVESLLNQGTLTGAEYYAVTARRPGLLEGLEDSSLYNTNVQRLTALLDRQPQTDAAVAAMKEELASLKDRYYGDGNRQLDRSLRRYAAGETGAEEYYRELLSLAGDRGLSLERFPQMRAYCAVTALARQLNTRRIGKELSSLVAQLKEILPYNEYTAITGKGLSAEETWAGIAAAARRHNIPLEEGFPAFARLARYLEASGAVNPLALLTEEKELVGRLHDALSLDRGEREIAFLADFFVRLQDYAANKLSSEDYEYYRAHHKEFGLLWEKYADAALLKSFDAATGLLTDYYEVNLERNERFLARLSAGLPSAPRAGSGRSASDLLAAAREIDVVVTGGFHTDGLAKLLDERGISTVVITPNVTAGTELSSALYDELLARQRAITFQALAVLALSQRPEDEQLASIAAARLHDCLAAGIAPERVTEEVRSYLRERGQEGIDFALEKETSSVYRFRVTAAGVEHLYRWEVRGDKSIRLLADETQVNELALTKAEAAAKGDRDFEAFMTGALTAMAQEGYSVSEEDNLRPDGMQVCGWRVNKDGASKGGIRVEVRDGQVHIKVFFPQLPAGRDWGRALLCAFLTHDNRWAGYRILMETPQPSASGMSKLLREFGVTVEEPYPNYWIVRGVIPSITKEGVAANGASGIFSKADNDLPARLTAPQLRVSAWTAVAAGIVSLAGMIVTGGMSWGAAGAALVSTVTGFLAPTALHEAGHLLTALLLRRSGEKISTTLSRREGIAVALTNTDPAVDYGRLAAKQAAVRRAGRVASFLCAAAAVVALPLAHGPLLAGMSFAAAAVALCQLFTADRPAKAERAAAKLSDREIERVRERLRDTLVIINAGGDGSRLGKGHKPTLPFNGLSMYDRALRALYAIGARNVMPAWRVNERYDYRGAVATMARGFRDMKVTPAETPKGFHQSLTGALRLAKEQGYKHVLCLNGDVLPNFAAMAEALYSDREKVVIVAQNKGDKGLQVRTGADGTIDSLTMDYTGEGPYPLGWFLPVTELETIDAMDEARQSQAFEMLVKEHYAEWTVARAVYPEAMGGSFNMNGINDWETLEAVLAKDLQPWGYQGSLRPRTAALVRALNAKADAATRDYFAPLLNTASPAQRLGGRTVTGITIALFAGLSFLTFVMAAGPFMYLAAQSSIAGLVLLGTIVVTSLVTHLYSARTIVMALFAAVSPQRTAPRVLLDDARLPKLSVVISVKNEPINVVRQALEGIARTDYPKDKLQVVLAASAKKGELDMRLAAQYRELEAAIPWLTYVELTNPEGTINGKAYTLNEVLGTLEGEYFTILDADSFLQARDLRHMVTIARDNEALPGARRTGLVQFARGVARIEGEKNNEFLLRMRALLHDTVLDRFVTPLRFRFGFPGHFGHADLVSTAAAKAAGGFNSDEVVEDLDIGFKLREQGYAVEFSNELFLSEGTSLSWAAHLKRSARIANGDASLLSAWSEKLFKSSGLAWNERFAIVSHLGRGLATIPVNIQLMAMTLLTLYVPNALVFSFAGFLAGLALVSILPSIFTIYNQPLVLLSSVVRLAADGKYREAGELVLMYPLFFVTTLLSNTYIAKPSLRAFFGPKIAFKVTPKKRTQSSLAAKIALNAPGILYGAFVLGGLGYVLFNTPLRGLLIGFASYTALSAGYYALKDFRDRRAAKRAAQHGEDEIAVTLDEHAYNALDGDDIARLDREYGRLHDPSSGAGREIAAKRSGNGGLSLDAYDRLLRTIAAKAGVKGKTVYYPFGGADPLTPFKLNPGAEDVISLGVEEFGPAKEINDFLSHEGPGSVARIGSYDSAYETQLFYYQYNLSGIGAVAAARIVALLDGRLTGLYYFKVNDDGSFSFADGPNGYEAGYRNAVIEFVDQAGQKKRFWYLQTDVYHDDPGLRNAIERGEFDAGTLLLKAAPDIWNDFQHPGEERARAIEKTLAVAKRSQKPGEPVAVVTDTWDDSGWRRNSAEEGARPIWAQGYTPATHQLAGNEAFGYSIRDGYVYYGTADGLITAETPTDQIPNFSAHQAQFEERPFFDDGFIMQGSKAKAAFDADAARDITEGYGARLQALLDEVSSVEGLSAAERDAVAAARGRNREIRGFEGIVKGGDDFLLGWNDGKSSRLYLAEDLIACIERTAPPGMARSLVDEYLAHELLCPLLGHEGAILLQQKLFPAHYPDAAALNMPGHPNKGLLGTWLRGYIDRRSLPAFSRQGLLWSLHTGWMQVRRLLAAAARPWTALSPAEREAEVARFAQAHRADPALASVYSVFSPEDEGRLAGDLAAHVGEGINHVGITVLVPGAEREGLFELGRVVVDGIPGKGSAVVTVLAGTVSADGRQAPVLYLAAEDDLPRPYLLGLGAREVIAEINANRQFRAELQDFYATAGIFGKLDTGRIAFAPCAVVQEGLAAAFANARSLPGAAEKDAVFKDTFYAFRAAASGDALSAPAAQADVALASGADVLLPLGERFAAGREKSTAAEDFLAWIRGDRDESLTDEELLRFLALYDGKGTALAPQDARPSFDLHSVNALNAAS